MEDLNSIDLLKQEIDQLKVSLKHKEELLKQLTQVYFSVCTKCKRLIQLYFLRSRMLCIMEF